MNLLRRLMFWGKYERPQMIFFPYPPRMELLMLPEAKREYMRKWRALCPSRGSTVFTDQDVERFWSKVDQGEPDKCWEWTAGVDGHGYGQFSLNDHPVKAHRFSFMLANGPAKHLVCHKCNNPLCVNPAHLYDGTHKENHKDSAAEHSKSRKLSLEDVELIRAWWGTGDHTQHALSVTFGVSQRAIFNVIHKHTYL